MSTIDPTEELLDTPLETALRRFRRLEKEVDEARDSDALRKKQQELVACGSEIRRLRKSEE